MASDPPVYVRACFGRKPHAWSKPIHSPTYDCMVQSCPHCGRVRRAVKAPPAAPDTGGAPNAQD